MHFTYLPFVTLIRLDMAQINPEVPDKSTSMALDQHKATERHGMQLGGLEDAFHQPTVSQVAHPEFTKLGNPGPLGLLSFAITTFIVGLYECGAGYE